MKINNWILCFLFLGVFLSCRKGRTSLEDELSKLPPETQQGNRTAGCLVNGKALLPKGSGLGPIYHCNYQQLGSTGNYFTLSFSDNSNTNRVIGVAMNTDSLSIHEGIILKLGSQGKGKASGRYTIMAGADSKFYSTYGLVSGEVHIKKMDPTNSIMAGTFWFTAVNSEGDTVKVTDGRFDMIYN